MNRYCEVCGTEFELKVPHGGRRKYCSDACSHEARKKQDRDRMRIAYYKNRRKRKPCELTCSKCGKTFYGHGCAKYCNDCLNDGTWYMTKLRDNRSMRRQLL